MSQGNARGSVPESQQWTYRQRPDSAGSAGPTWSADSQYQRPQTSSSTVQAHREKPEGGFLPFITATDLQTSIAPPGKKLAAIRVSNPPPPLAQTNVSTFEPTQPRSNKTRLNLLNPMSLLARRRTAQVTQYSAPTPNAANLVDSRPSAGYDPRIRGTKVHDFSAPRPRRNVSYNDIQDLRDAKLGLPQYQRPPSSHHGESNKLAVEEKDSNRWSGGNHTPAFTEDFDEEQYPAAGPNVRKANDFTDLKLPKPPYAIRSAQSSDQLSKTTVTDAELVQISKLQPEFSLGPSRQTVDTPYKQDNVLQLPSRPAPIPDEIGLKSEGIMNVSKSFSMKSRPRNISQVSANDLAMAQFPKHMKSTSSRFSFDMVGAASQEKLLEDRHRQKALERKSLSPDPQDESSIYGGDDADYDDMLEDNELEERIPGVNADIEDNEFEDLSEPSLGGFTFHPMAISSATSPLSPRSPGPVSTPRDANGEVIGFAISKESPSMPTSQSSIQLGYHEESDHMKYNELGDVIGYQGLDLRSIEANRIPDKEFQKIGSAQGDTSLFDQMSKIVQGNDDLYFDDGLIAPPSDGDDIPEFDESLFDNDDTDEYGRPIRPLSSLPTLYSPPCVKPDNARNAKNVNETEHDRRISQELEDPDSAMSSQSLNRAVFTRPTADRTNSVNQPIQQGQSLTQDTLSAYQSALAAATYKAAANGRFRRDSSTTMHFDERDEHPDMIKDTNCEKSDSSIEQQLTSDYEDDFDYDDALEDDPIIAEANAEALANDSDGFYGQEFGFYSAPAAGETQFGGYFNSYGANGAVSNQNGRVVLREPNLTPITERSEYSNRNSIMSLPLSAVSHGGGLGALNNPGLLQLAGMMNEYNDENMSLEALLKLRRGAWGGSQASLHSSNGNGSPMSAGGEDASPVQQSPLVQSSSLGHSRQSSGHSFASEFANSEATEATSSPASPTLTMSSPAKIPHNSNPKSGLPAPPASLLSSLNSRPMSPISKLSSAIGMISNESGGDIGNVPFTKPKGKHHHSVSSDSISYMKEDDPVVGERWVLERRRTAESGQVEILGREVVSGGRI